MCYVHSRTTICLSICFQFSWVYIWEWNCCVISHLCLCFCRMAKLFFTKKATILHYYQQCKMVPISPHSEFFIFKIISILVSANLYLIGLIYISYCLMILSIFSRVCYPFTVIFSFGEISIQILCPHLFDCCFLLLICRFSIYSIY